MNNNDYYDTTQSMVNEYLNTPLTSSPDSPITPETMYDNRGKYFDSFLFNKKFDAFIEQQNEQRLLKQHAELGDLNNIANMEIKPYELPINKILINIKNTWFFMFDNIMNFNSPFTDFTLDDIFYVGITFIVIALLYLLLVNIFY